ncbi:hypothetical protein K440DRAFT_658579 [Wilcoxina mikolae CBS 423.85]|nr:hypothetical protein K440DRAFT_658579 [Wilcoxina mikolae CBS 423.85]
MAASFPRPSLGSSLLALSGTRDRKLVLGTSCSAIDDVLNGGFPYGSVTSISGSVPSTKTLVAMHAFASHLLSDPTTEATWVDTNGNYSGRSLKDIICFKLLQKPGDVNQVLERAKVARVFDLLGLGEAIDEIKLDHEKRQRATDIVRDSDGEDEDEDDVAESIPYTETKRGVRLIVVDNITQPYASMVNKSQLEGQAMLVTIQRSLALLSRDLNIAVLLLNDVPSATSTLQSKYSSRHNTFQSVFGSVPWRLPHGPTYAYGVDLHLLLSQHPHGPEDATSRLGEGFKNSPREDTVVEVLVDRIGARSGRWRAFTIVGTQLREPTTL